MFYILLIPNVVFPWCFDALMATIFNYCTQRDLSLEDALLIVACYSVSDLLGLKIKFENFLAMSFDGRPRL